MEKKILELLSHLEAVEEQLGQLETINDKKKYRALAQEHSYLTEIQQEWKKLSLAQKNLKDAKQLLVHESDAEFRKVLEEEILSSQTSIEEQEEILKNLLIPPDPNDHRNTIIEVRAGTGGDEAALFVGDCVRMYKMFSDRMGWKWEQLSCTEAEVGGYKEYVMVISGPNVYRNLKHEGGTHRVQRVPTTESQGRVHTSAITVAVLIEPDEDAEVNINEKDLRIDTFRSSGAGGQHVNTTDSAVRLTHLPTGVVAECQDERSQHKNRDKAMRILKAKIAEMERRKKEQEIANDRASQVGSGDRSERIRTYNFPQNRVTDHRVGLTLYNLDLVISGQLEKFAAALVANHHEEQLKSIRS